MSNELWPTQINLKNKGKNLYIYFNNGSELSFTSEFLRVMSPSAEVQGHSPAQRKVIPGKKNVTIISVEPVGNYAVRLSFDDRHNTGIFTWSYFLEMNEKRVSLWQRYLDELAEKGWSRETGQPH